VTHASGDETHSPKEASGGESGGDDHTSTRDARRAPRDPQDYIAFKKELLEKAEKNFDTPAPAGSKRNRGWYVNAHVMRQRFVSQLHTIIFDELSLITPEMFELLNELCKTIRRNKRLFGGIRLVRERPAPRVAAASASFD